MRAQSEAGQAEASPGRRSIGINRRLLDATFDIGVPGDFN
jgi:hypothetical protein